MTKLSRALAPLRFTISQKKHSVTFYNSYLTLGYGKCTASLEDAYATVPATAAALTQLSLFCSLVNHSSTFGYFSNVPWYPNAFIADPFGK